MFDEYTPYSLKFSDGPAPCHLSFGRVPSAFIPWPELPNDSSLNQVTVGFAYEYVTARILLACK